MKRRVLHTPPSGARASHSVTIGPPATGTFFSAPPAKKAIQCASGEKKGDDAPSVPSRTIGSVSYTHLTLPTIYSV